MSHANRDRVLFPVSTLFISFSCFVLMGLLVLCWIWVVGLGILPLFPTLKIEIQCFTTKCDVYYRVFVYLIKLKKLLSISSLLKTFKSWMLFLHHLAWLCDFSLCYVSLLIWWITLMLEYWTSFGFLEQILLSCGVV